VCDGWTVRQDVLRRCALGRIIPGRGHSLQMRRCRRCNSDAASRGARVLEDVREVFQPSVPGGRCPRVALSEEATDAADQRKCASPGQWSRGPVVGNLKTKTTRIAYAGRRLPQLIRHAEVTGVD